MKEAFKITFVLTVVCVICAFLLALVNSTVREKIETNNRKKIEESIFKLLSITKGIEKVTLEDQIIYKLFDINQKHIGYAFLAKGNGYQGTIKLLAVVDASFERLEGIEVIESVETPGLGAKITEDFFKRQFKGLNILKKLECIKEDNVEDNQIKAISGATISSRSVVNILNKNIEELRIKLKK